MSGRLCCVSDIGLLYTVHYTAFCLGGPFLSGHGVHTTELSGADGR